ncbi:MAG TPA: hypothetical protein VNA20_17935 [Frankiaceae bacterium]|nr:hypothetical protein [Frankiaceae bacterium]
MTQIIRDPVTTEEFIRDPSGVLTRLGMQPRTTPEIHHRVNRIFYAVLTNTDLMDLAVEHFSRLPAQYLEDNAPVADEALGRGELANTMELDEAATEHAFVDPEFLRRAYSLTLHDLNERGLLLTRHPREDIDDFVERLVTAIQERRPLREIPTFEQWDEHYGVGTGYGVGEVVVGPVAVAVVGAEAGGVVTAVVLGADASFRLDSAVAEQALRGDRAAAQKLATAGAVLRLAGEMLIHANNFERR